MGIDVQAFERDLDRFDEAMRADIVDARFQLGEKALHKLKEKSPVKTGNYVYNHTVSSGAVKGGVVIEVASRAERMADVDMAQRMINKEKFGNEMILRETMKLSTMKNVTTVVKIDNDVHYADLIEGGYSKQTGPEGVYGVVGNSLVDEPVIIKERII